MTMSSHPGPATGCGLLTAHPEAPVDSAGLSSVALGGSNDSTGGSDGMASLHRRASGGGGRLTVAEQRFIGRAGGRR